LLKEGRREEATKIRKQHPEWKYAKVLNKYSTILKTYSNMIDRIIKSKTLSTEEKRKRIKELEKKRVEAARRANKFMKKYQQK